MTKTIEFLMDWTVRAAGGRSFKKGERLTCRGDTAHHYVSRNRAKYVETTTPKPATPTPVETDEPVKRGPGRPPKDVTNG